MNALRHEVLDGVNLAVSRRPDDRAVPAPVDLGQVCVSRCQEMQDGNPAESGGQEYGAVPGTTALVHVDLRHGQQLLQTLLVAFLDGAEDRGQYEVVLLRQNTVNASKKKRRKPILFQYMMMCTKVFPNAAA